MAYKVLEYFEDLQDNRHRYHAGDTFPRMGYMPSEKRIAELCGTKNKRGRALIEAIPQDPIPEVAQQETIPEISTEPKVEDPKVDEPVVAEPAKPKRGRKKKTE